MQTGFVRKVLFFIEKNMEKFGGVGNMYYLCTRNSEMSQSLMNMQRGVAQLGSASGLGPGGRRFESCHPDFLSNSLEKERR